MYLFLRLMGFNKTKKKLVVFSIISVLILTWCLSIGELFSDPYSTIIRSSNGNLLSARIASDGQWRFPCSDSIPDKYKKAVVFFEDEYFHYHLGINPVSIVRAFSQNMFSDKIISGGSTLSMQLIRLSRKGKSRTYSEKVIEILLAIRLELTHSKADILNLYASHAPFGGNVVGLEAASWRYYGRSSNLLSWGEITTLAVLPNAPSLIYPGKNHQLLLSKRNRLLDKLSRNEILTKENCELAKEEPLPQKPIPLPQHTPHLLNRSFKDGIKNKQIYSSINQELQLSLNELMKRYHFRLSQNEIQNAALLVIDVKNAKVLSYVGNTNCKVEDCGANVDVITANRSTGSTLKPLLYISMLENGTLLPTALIEDVPTKISGYSPQNFNRSYDGAVPANDALVRSLNIPAVKLLQNYGVQEFYKRLNELQISTINRGASHYGLSLILGGAECTLWELCEAYYFLAKKLNNQSLKPISYLKEINVESALELDNFSKASIFQVFEMLTQVNRPLEEGAWKIFESSKKIAWKTGTSFGQRDAWSVGITPEYIVGVWVGNADGEGRPGLTGVKMAAPLMFETFKKLNTTTWFESPESELKTIEICAQSGFRKSINCPESRFIRNHEMGIHYPTCEYHKIIHLDNNEKFRVNSSCYDVSTMKEKSWFSLPPVQEWYYRLRHPSYKKLPELHPDCIVNNERVMDLIYPNDGLKIYIPKNLDGSLSASVFEMAHKNPAAEIYWYIDEQFLGKTKRNHKMEISANEGVHKFVFIDEMGNTFKKNIEFIYR